MKQRIARYLALSSSLVLACLMPLTAAQAEQQEIRIARQFGVGYLPTMIMEEQGLIEKHAKNLGLTDIKTTWLQLANAAAMNDALLSGNLDFASGATTAAIIAWDRTRGTKSEIKGVSGESVIPFTLYTNKPEVKTIEDFKQGDQIALTAVKVTTYAILLQMEAAKRFGTENYAKIDPLTVSMAHPDAIQAMFNKQIAAHFTWPPYSYVEAAHEGIHKVVDSTEILDGQPMSSTVIWARKAFHDQHPKLYQAFIDAMQEAVDFIRNNKAETAAIYKKQTKSTEPIEQILNDPAVNFDLAPRATMKFAEFLHSIGTIKNKPESWQDVFFPEVHKLDGN